MSNFSLRSLLTVDAVTCLALGVLLLITADLIADVMAIPAALLFGAGMLLMPIGAFMAVVARQHRPAAWAVGIIVIGNIGWVIASIGLPLAGIFTPNLIGWIFILGQSAVVAALAFMESRASTDLQAYA